MSNTPDDSLPESQPDRAARFAWSNMWASPDDDPRSEGGFGDERSMLVGYLRDYRLTLEMKCADLDAAGLARRSVPPSNMSLLGLVRHMADVERGWFRRVMAGQDAPPRYRSDSDHDLDFNGATPDADVVTDAWTAWKEEIAFAEQYVDASPDLGAVGRMRDGKTIALREVLLHMIEEYARHCGHADLIRERVDGRIGQ